MSHLIFLTLFFFGLANKSSSNENISEFRKSIIDFFPFFMSLCNYSSALIIAFIKSALLYFLIYKVLGNDLPRISGGVSEGKYGRKP
jgi:hypothetical protein